MRITIEYADATRNVSYANFDGEDLTFWSDEFWVYVGSPVGTGSPDAIFARDRVTAVRRTNE